MASSSNNANTNGNAALTMNIIQTPSDYDILCGQGKECNDALGSRRYRCVVDAYQPKYNAALTRHDKMGVTMEIYEVLARTNSRFLKRSTDNAWQEVSFLVARDKIGHALRFRNRAISALAKKHNSSRKQHHDQGQGVAMPSTTKERPPPAPAMSSSSSSSSSLASSSRRWEILEHTKIQFSQVAARSFGSEQHLLTASSTQQPPLQPPDLWASQTGTALYQSNGCYPGNSSSQPSAAGVPEYQDLMMTQLLTCPSRRTLEPQAVMPLPSSLDDCVKLPPFDATPTPVLFQDLSAQLLDCPGTAAATTSSKAVIPPPIYGIPSSSLSQNLSLLSHFDDSSCSDALLLSSPTTTKCDPISPIPDAKLSSSLSSSSLSSYSQDSASWPMVQMIKGQQGTLDCGSVLSFEI